MTTWSEVLEARTNERGDLIARIKLEYVEPLRKQWGMYDEEVQYDILASMLEPYGFDWACAWYDWTFIKDEAKYHFTPDDWKHLRMGFWIFVSRVELAQWEKEYLENHGGLYSGFLGDLNRAIETIESQEMPRVKEPTVEHPLPPFQLDDDEDEDYEEKDDWTWFDDSDLPF